MTQCDIVLSYHIPETGKPCPQHPDADGSAPAIARILIEAGYSVPTGQDDSPQVASLSRIRALQVCKAFVVLVSKTYGDPQLSSHTQKEYLAAKDAGLPILPVYHSGRFPPPGLQDAMGPFMQYVPQSGAMTGPDPCSEEQV